MTDSRTDRGPAARRARALAREETSGQRARARLGIHVWPADWPEPSTWDVPGTAKPKRRRRR